MLSCQPLVSYIITLVVSQVSHGPRSKVQQKHNHPLVYISHSVTTLSSTRKQVKWYEDRTWSSVLCSSLTHPAACPGTGSAARYTPHGSACLWLRAALASAPPPLCTDHRHHQLLWKHLVLTFLTCTIKEEPKLWPVKVHVFKWSTPTPKKRRSKNPSA